MERVLDLLANFDILYLPQTIIESLWHSSWKSAYRQAGRMGLGREVIDSLFGFNSYQFYVSMNRGWSGRSISSLLMRHGINMWGWTFANGEMFFRVKKKQAAWAQYVMLRASVPLQGPLLSRTPDVSAAISSPSESPSQRSAGSPNDLTMDVERQLGGLIEKVSSFLDL
jgi:hypothetical protein